MSDFYPKLAATVSRLVGLRGQTVTLKRSTGGTIDPVTGTVTAGTTTNFTTLGMPQSYPDSLIDGTRIQASDRIMVLTPAVKPLLTDTLSFDGQDWTIISIKTTNPAGTPVVYFVQVRL